MPRLRVPVQLRWPDLDTNGHVNNVAYLTLLEEVRIRALHPIIGRRLTTGAAPVVVARHEVEYVRQLSWSEAPIEVELWAARLGTSSCEIHHVLRSTAGDECARAITVLVYLDPETQRSRPLTEHERAAYSTLLDAPLEMRGARTYAASGTPGP